MILKIQIYNEEILTLSGKVSKHIYVSIFINKQKSTLLILILSRTL